MHLRKPQNSLSILSPLDLRITINHTHIQETEYYIFQLATQPGCREQTTSKEIVDIGNEAIFLPATIEAQKAGRFGGKDYGEH